MVQSMRETQMNASNDLSSDEEDAWGKGWAPEFLGTRIYEKPNDYVVWTILSTFLCCMPTGLVGLYFSLQVHRNWQERNISGAYDSSTKAKTWAYISLVLGISGWFCVLILVYLFFFLPRG